MLLGSFSAIVTIKGRQSAWEMVKKQLRIAHPEEMEKSIVQVQKNGKIWWVTPKKNLAITSNIWMAQVCLIESSQLFCVDFFFVIGGGPAYVWKTTYFEKMCHHIMGKDCPNVPQGIPVSIPLKLIIHNVFQFFFKHLSWEVCAQKRPMHSKSHATPPTYRFGSSRTQTAATKSTNIRMKMRAMSKILHRLLAAARIHQCRIVYQPEARHRCAHRPHWCVGEACDRHRMLSGDHWTWPLSNKSTRNGCI